MNKGPGAEEPSMPSGEEANGKGLEVGSLNVCKLEGQSRVLRVGRESGRVKVGTWSVD